MNADKSDKLVLNLEGNADLSAYLAKKATGDACEFSVEANLDEVAGNQAVFSVTGATVMADAEELPEVSEDGAEGKAEPAELPDFPA